MPEKIKSPLLNLDQFRYYEALTAWFRKRFDTELEPRAFVKTPGVVFAIAQAVRAFSEEGDGVLIQPPVYYPFYG